jgi:hypothetical protein
LVFLGLFRGVWCGSREYIAILDCGRRESARIFLWRGRKRRVGGDEGGEWVRGKRRVVVLRDGE